MSSPFTTGETEYIQERRLARLATVGPDGTPHVRPVAFRLNVGDGTIDIGGPRLAASQKYRNVVAEPRAAIVIDDVAPAGSRSPRPGLGRGVEVRGAAEPLRVEERSERVAPYHSDELIRIRPSRVITWNLPSGAAEVRGREVR
jgi:pyridoxamine 5'-phosphate oxidase family protein